MIKVIILGLLFTLLFCSVVIYSYISVTNSIELNKLDTEISEVEIELKKQKDRLKKLNTQSLEFLFVRHEVTNSIIKIEHLKSLKEVYTWRGR